MEFKSIIEAFKVCSDERYFTHEYMQYRNFLGQDTISYIRNKILLLNKNTLFNLIATDGVVTLRGYFSKHQYINLRKMFPFLPKKLTMGVINYKDKTFKTFNTSNYIDWTKVKFQYNNNVNMPFFGFQSYERVAKIYKYLKYTSVTSVTFYPDKWQALYGTCDFKNYSLTIAALNPKVFK